jgi:hypothetical protein
MSNPMRLETEVSRQIPRNGPFFDCQGAPSLPSREILGDVVGYIPIRRSLAKMSITT